MANQNIGSLTTLAAADVDVANDRFVVWDNSESGAARTKAMTVEETTKLMPQEWRATFDGQGTVIVNGVKTYLPVARADTIAQASLVADVSGSVTVTVQRYTPSGGALGSPTTLGTISLSSAVHIRDTTLSGWTKSVSAGDVLEISIGGTIASITRLNVHLST